MLPSCVQTVVQIFSRYIMTSDVLPRGVTGVGVRMDSVLPALTRKTKTFRLITKKLFACQTTPPRRDRSGHRHKVSVCFYDFIRWLTKQKELSTFWTRNSEVLSLEQSLLLSGKLGLSSKYTIYDFKPVFINNSLIFYSQHEKLITLENITVW